MANLTFGQVLIIGTVATVGFTLLCYGWSGYMARRNRSYQVRAKAAKPNAPSASAAKGRPGSNHGAAASRGTGAGQAQGQAQDPPQQPRAAAKRPASAPRPTRSK